MNEPSNISIITRATTQPEQNFLPNRKNSSAVRLFGDLKVRPKLMVLHNLFFLLLTCAVYFSIIPLFEKQVADAQARELTILHQTHTAGQDPYAEATARAK